jgi:hypothetical protein
MPFAKAVTDVYSDITVKIVLINRNVVEGVIEFCNTHAFDLIIMGTRGSSGIKEVIIGSVTANVIAKTRTPVLAVPHEYVMEEPDAMLFSTSHYEREISLLEKIIAITGLFGTTVHVVVFEEINTAQANYHAYNTQQIQQYVDFLKNSFRGISFKGKLVQGTSF